MGFGVWVCLGEGLIGVRVSLVVGFLGGGFLGGWDYIIEVSGSGLKVVQNLLKG